MSTANINGQVVDVKVIEADGSPGTSLTEAEIGLLSALDAQLQAHPAFGQAYPRAQLTRVDSNRLLEASEEGRMYLRYHHERGDVEFWGHRATSPTVDMTRGIVTVASVPPSGGG